MARSKTKNDRTRSGSQPKKKINPTIFICPYTEQNVYIERATLSDLKSKSTFHSGGRKRLWMLSSSQLRHDLYADAAQAIASHEQSLLPSFGGRSWEVTCSMSEENGNTLFRAWKGKMELAVLPHLMEKIPDPPRWPGRKSRQLDEYFVNDDEQEIFKLQTREVSTLSSVAWDLKHLYPVPAVSTKWLSPCHKIFTSRKMAWDHATELAKREILIDKHILGIGATGKLLQPTIPSVPMALKIGKLRFERDGLWVVNQELMWQEDRALVLEEEQEENEASEEAISKRKRKSTGSVVKPDKQQVETPGEEHRSNPKKTKGASSFSCHSETRNRGYCDEKHKTICGVKLSSKQAETDLRELWNTLTSEEQGYWRDRLRSSIVREGESSGTSKCEEMVWTNSSIEDFGKTVGDGTSNHHVMSTPSETNCATEICVPRISATNQYFATIKSLAQSNGKLEVPEDFEYSEGHGERLENGLQNKRMSYAGQFNPVVAFQAAVPPNASKEADDSAGSEERLEFTCGSKSPEEQLIELSPVVPSNSVHARGSRRRRERSSRRKHPTEKATRRWCLNDEQIEICYTACMGHYEDVMRTVKARDLARELADGFDVLRERGRGRFDMELPAFDTEQFSFLTDLQKAPWIPIVKCILGEDIVLIHKGCFLSLPGAEVQSYHQDGVHLNNQTQKPCHAINVFIPLCDLDSRNGPTEFCLGSHILGNEGFDKDFVETPKPKAGTPIIFDYRLGHRGLGNSSTKCRPIVYCTYARGAADGKEFFDRVNFSRKRWHKLGKISEKPLSREERRLNRKRSLESRHVEGEEMKIVIPAEQHTIPKEKEKDLDALNVENSPVVASKIVDNQRDRKEGKDNIARKEGSFSEKESPAESSPVLHLPPDVTVPRDR